MLGARREEYKTAHVRIELTDSYIASEDGTLRRADRDKIAGLSHGTATTVAADAASLITARNNEQYVEKKMSVSLPKKAKQAKPPAKGEAGKDFATGAATLVLRFKITLVVPKPLPHFSLLDALTRPAGTALH